MNLKGRNFLKLKDFTPEEIRYMLDAMTAWSAGTLHLFLKKPVPEPAAPLK